MDARIQEARRELARRELARRGSSVTSQQDSSVATEGMGYIAQHPFKSTFEPLAKTLTGKSLQDRALDATTPQPHPVQRDARGTVMMPTALDYSGDFTRQATAGMFGSAADMATTPGNYLIGPVIKGASAVSQGVFGAARGSVKGVKSFFDIDQKALSLGQKVRTVASEAKKSAVDKFGSQIDTLAKANPGKSISIRDVVDGINTNINDMPSEVKVALRKIPKLKDMLNNPNLADQVSLKDTQEIINHINTKIPKNIKYNHLDIIDTLNDIKAAQLDAFEDMATLRSDYGKFAEDYKLLKGALNPKATPNAILNNFSNNIAVKDAAKRILSPVVKDMKKLRSQAGTINLVKKLLIGSLPVGGAYLGYKTLTGD